MKIYGLFILLLGFLAQVRAGFRITLDENAQALCKKYKMMCKDKKICAVQHFIWPKNITIPVCIPLSYVPAQNMICQLPYDAGNCHARYIRWYYNVHAQKCTHFRYGGCNGNPNNFMNKKECEDICMATPRILYDGGSALVQMKPSIMTAPIYQPPTVKKYEALNSVIANPQDNSYDRYPVRVRPGNRVRSDETNTRKRRRLDKERAKERRRRERRKEKRRLRRLRRKKNKKQKGKKNRKNRKSKKRKNKKTEIGEVNETDKTEAVDDKKVTVPEMKNDIDDTEMEAADDPKGRRSKKDKKRRKRRQRRKRRLEKELREKRAKQSLLQSKRRMLTLLSRAELEANQNQRETTQT